MMRMASKKENSLIARFLFPPLIIVTAVLCLWENEGRFDFYKAAKESVAISSSEINQTQSIGAISYTGTNHPSPIFEEYVGKFEGYLMISRSTEIYSWEETSSKKGSKWSLGWHSSLQSNSRNHGLVKKLTNAGRYPDQYKIDRFVIFPKQIHFVDTTIPLATTTMKLTEQGKSLGLAFGPSGDGNYLYRRLYQERQLGDERVRYDGVPVEQIITYFGKIENSHGMVKQYDIKKSWVSALILNDGILHHLVNGTRLVALEKIRAYFKMLKWLIRGLGMLGLFFGFCFILEKFVHVLLDLPLIGDIVSFGVWGASLLMALLVGASTMILSMLSNNLQITFPIIAGILLMTYYLFKSHKTTKANAREFLQRNSPGPLTPEFENQRKEQTFITLVKLALMEEGLSPKENRFLVSWGKKQGLSEETMTQLFHLHQGRKDSSAIPLKINMQDFTILISLALCDGFLSSKELAHITTLAQQLNLGPQDVKNIIHQVKNGQSPAPVVKNAA